MLYIIEVAAVKQIYLGLCFFLSGLKTNKQQQPCVARVFSVCAVLVLHILRMPPRAFGQWSPSWDSASYLSK